MDHLEKELRKEFQLERIILFTDAVFAIAITLLVIEIKVPAIHEIPEGETIDSAIGNQLLRMIPLFIGFFISFFVIAQYWTVHHRLFGYLHNYSTKLLWSNILYLLGIVLLPFSTAFFSEYFMNNAKLPFTIYLLNILYLASMNTRLWYIIAEPKNKLSKLDHKTTFVKYYVTRSYLVPIVFILAFVFSFINNWISVIMLWSMPFYGILIKKYFKQKFDFEPERRY
jgi:uncharacterized membrane protein